VPKLPLTVESVERLTGSLWGVTVVFADGTTGHYLVPDNLATLEAVRISAIALAVLAEGPGGMFEAPHRVHTRYDPRMI